MPDRGARYADRSIVKVTRSLKKTYAQAQRELESKLKDFNARFKAKDKQKRAQRDAGEITEQQYKDWLSGQVFIRNQWESKIRQVNAVMLDYNKQAMNIVNNSRFDVFAENYYSEAFRAQWIVNDLSWNVYNSQAIAKLIKDNPQILPKWKIDKEKDYKWNYQKVNNIIQQGIIQGEGVEQITKRLCTDLSSMNENKMRMFARTGITEAQNSGRQEQMRQAAEELDIEQEKEWQATFDNRTRDAHRHLDGQRVPWNEPFQSDLGEIRYPGDPTAEPANVYNCRCTMKTIYPQYEDRSKNFREDVTIDGLSYEEWKYENYHAPDKYLKKDYSKYIDTNISISEESEKMIDEALEKGYNAFEPLRNSIREILYTRVPGGSSATPDGETIKLDKRTFSTIESAKKRLQELIDEGHTQNTTDPRFMIAHEMGHCIETYIARKRRNLNTGIIRGYQQMLIDNEEQIMGSQYYTHMGFGDDLEYEDIRDIISKEIGNRALDSTSELFAQCFANVLYGTKPSIHAKLLVEYVISLANGGK